MNTLTPHVTKGILNSAATVTGPNVNIESMNGIAILQVTYP